MFLAGARYDLSLSASERAVTSAAQSRLVTERGPKASSTCEPSPIRHRPRGPRDLELAGDFDLTTRAGGDHGRERANADHRAPFEFHLEVRRGGAMDFQVVLLRMYIVGVVLARNHFFVHFLMTLPPLSLLDALRAG